MFTLHKPATAQLDRILLAQEGLAPSYSEIGLTRAGRLPTGGYHVHRAKIELGEGEQVFNRACDALCQWRHLDLEGISVYPPKPAINQGTTLIVNADHIFLWSINACRIIYVADESDERGKRFGYGYGTLPEHSEKGEERFLLEWDTTCNKVTYEIIAFSRSNKLLVSLFWPVAVFIQDQFRLRSLNSLRRYVDHFELAYDRQNELRKRRP